MYFPTEKSLSEIREEVNLLVGEATVDDARTISISGHRGV
jgi:hypothetical protein